MLEAIAKPFGWLMLQLYEFVGNYGVAVILFALLVKIILLPFQLKSKKSMMKTSRMTPRLKELEKKFGNDQQRYQQEMNKLYKEEGVNPMSGCLWSLIPFPILLALYRAIRFPLTTMMGVDSSLLAAATDTTQAGALLAKMQELGYNLSNYSTGRNASVYEQIFQSQFITSHFGELSSFSEKLKPITYNFLGLDLGLTPKLMFWNSDHVGMMFGLFLIPVLSAVLSWLSMKISTASNPQTASTQQSTKSMELMMPLMSLWICFAMPAVMGIYWIAQSVFSIIQDLILTKIFNKQLDKEDAERIEREKARAAELEAKHAETERQKAAGTTQVNKNTSKKNQRAVAAQKEAERKAAEARAIKLAKNGPRVLPDSQVGDRRYARGRAYVADRYSNPDEAEVKTAEAAAESDEYEAENPSVVIESETAEAPEVTEAEAAVETEEPVEAEDAGEAEESEDAEEPDEVDEAEEDEDAAENESPDDEDMPAEEETEAPAEESEESADESAAE